MDEKTIAQHKIGLTFHKQMVDFNQIMLKQDKDKVEHYKKKLAKQDPEQLFNEERLAEVEIKLANTKEDLEQDRSMVVFHRLELAGVSCDKLGAIYNKEISADSKLWVTYFKKEVANYEKWLEHFKKRLAFHEQELQNHKE